MPNKFSRGIVTLISISFNFLVDCVIHVGLLSTAFLTPDYSYQWLIQDFPEEGAPTYYFDPGAPPRSATGYVSTKSFREVNVK